MSEVGSLFCPKYLHRPYQVLFFETDELAVIILSLFLGLLLSGYFFLMAIILPFILGYLKKKMPRGYLKHYLYCLGLIVYKGAPTFFESRCFE